MAQRTHQANAPTSGQQVSLIRPGIAAVKLDENLCMSCCGHQQQEKASRTMTIARQWMEQPTVGSAFGMQFIIVRFCKKIYINLCIICIIYTYYIYILYYYIYTYIRIYSLFVFLVDASWIWICPLVGFARAWIWGVHSHAMHLTIALLLRSSCSCGTTCSPQCQWDSLKTSCVNIHVGLKATFSKTEAFNIACGQFIIAAAVTWPRRRRESGARVDLHIVCT